MLIKSLKNKVILFPASEIHVFFLVRTCGLFDSALTLQIEDYEFSIP